MTGVRRSAQPATVVAAQARLRGASVGVVGPVERRAELLTEIGAVLRFPGYYGRNLDALEECLTDLSWLPEGEVVLVWDGDAALRRADPVGHASMMEILSAAVDAMAPTARPLRVVLAEGIGSSRTS